ncbi:O-antigen polymerase [Acinetobacter kyonggiensis]|uniref:Oligosaccharide repeat unit polymerase n=1 Tax=Acinetobacter kyonggiensis TaxID=595670 RepID=A0A1H3KDE4_9GAMM|nr:O-antigen polymerase [Acinetobacter kyonggiensis]SDY50136.1 hypothetical protein SAMN05421643_11224 [Acinetobacter kyonggiensis]
MRFKIFLPLIILSFFQIIGFFCYDRFNYSYIQNYKVGILILFLYISLILPVLFFCIIEKKNKIKFEKVNVNSKYNFIFMFIALVFLLKPLIVMFGVGYEMGFEYLRINYYTDDSLRTMIYGHPTIATLINFYVIPLLWAYLVFVSNAQNKSANLAFYLILFLLILFNMSYGGRFNIYFGLLILYYKTILNGGNVFNYIRKYSALILLLVFSSFWVLISRRNEDSDFFLQGFVEVLEYHLLPPFILAQSIDFSILNYDGYPFRIVVTSFLAPVSFLLGIDGKLLPYAYYPSLLSEFRLYSFSSNSWYNAFGTLFNFFFVDNGYFAPVLVFIFITYLIYSSFLISSQDKRNKYLVYVSFMLYSSLFQAPIFSPGVIFIILLFPFFCHYLKAK